MPSGPGITISCPDGIVLNGTDTIGILDLSDDENAVEAADTVKVTKGAEDKFLIMLHVSGIYLQLIVIIT